MKKLFLTVFICIQVIGILLTPAQVQAQVTKAWSGRCVSTEAVGTSTAQVATLEGIECLVANILNIAVTAIAIASFIMLLVGGLYHLASGGNPKNLETANKTMTYALLGVIASVSGWIVINFLTTFTGIDFSIFRINLDY